MSFLHPEAFWALPAAGLLVFLSFWRRRPPVLRVPSIAPWRQVQDRVPPVRSLRAPTWSLVLLLQVLAMAAGIAALAGPGREEQGTRPRRLAVVVDLSPAMAPRLAAVRAELAKLDADDEVVVIESPSLKRHAGRTPALAVAPRRGRPGLALDLAASLAPKVLWISDREAEWKPPAGVDYVPVLVGGALANGAIVDANVEGDSLFVRLAAEGKVELEIDGLVRTLGPGRSFVEPVPAGARRIALRLPADEIPADDSVVLERRRAPLQVAVTGRPDRELRAALEANPALRLLQGGTPEVEIRVGADAGPSTAPVVIDLDPRSGPVASWGPAGAIKVDDPAFRSVVGAGDLRVREVGRLEGTWERAVLSSDGRPFAASRAGGREWIVAARYGAGDWPVHPSYPLFWARLLESVPVAPGGWRAEGLLDAEASTPGTGRRPLDPASLGGRPAGGRRTDWVPAAALLAALLAAASWMADYQRRDS